ncbi:glycosyl hydrolase family 28 protein [Oleiharenicola lentus]|uniref:glycosyl hydrolase family 28 protein n=1 Tax=Oleiharenicola lentus TaxID=2508720 RepID=UPI003F66C1EA
MKISLLRFFAATCLSLSATLVSRAVIEAYPRPYVFPASTTYSLSVDGVSVPVIKFDGGYDYAHFSRVSGSMNLSVTLLSGAITQWAISPAKLGITPTVSGSTMAFTLSQERYLIIAMNGLRRLVIAIDPPYTKPASSGAGIYNVVASPFNAPNNGSGWATSGIQGAVDAAHNAGGGIVYVPSGVYYVGNLTLKSNVHLFMEPGAVFRFHGTPANYTQDAFKSSQNRWLSWWIKTSVGANNVKIYGRGTLDGNAAYSIANYNFACNIVVPLGCSNFTMDGILVRDAGTWGIIPARSNDLLFTNLKMFNSLNLGEDDGIDVNESQRVVVRNAIGIALDDPFTTKTWAGTGITVNWPGSPEVVDDVLFENCVSYTYCYGFKVGQGINQPQSNVRFVNGTVFSASIGIGVDAKWGTADANAIRFESIDIERVPTFNAGHRVWFHSIIQNADGLGGSDVFSVYLKNINVRDDGTTAGAIHGYSAGRSFDTITFENIRMPGSTTRATTLGQMNITDVVNATNITVK